MFGHLIVTEYPIIIRALLSIQCIYTAHIKSPHQNGIFDWRGFPWSGAINILISQIPTLPHLSLYWGGWDITLIGTGPVAVSGGRDWAGQ